MGRQFSGRDIEMARTALRETDDIAAKLLRCGIASEALRRNVPLSPEKDTTLTLQSFFGISFFFFPFPMFLAFVVRFSFVSQRLFRASAKKTLAFFRGFPCIFSEKQGLEGQGNEIQKGRSLISEMYCVDE